VDRTTTQQALLLERQYRIAVWWATHVEIASALAQLLRLEKITASEHAHAKQQAEQLAMVWRIVAPSAKIAFDARGLLARFPLRAADALQLAAALEWCEGKPARRMFLTFDQRLSEAAGLAGFALQ
jgi:predicted nucleic acid-binding protein